MHRDALGATGTIAFCISNPPVRLTFLIVLERGSVNTRQEAVRFYLSSQIPFATVPAFEEI